MYVCRSQLVAETSRSADVLTLPDARAWERVPVQSLPYPQTSYRDRARALSHRAPDQDLVPEPPHEVQEGDPAHQGVERFVLRRDGWSTGSRMPQGSPRTCPLGRFCHRSWSGKQDRSNTLAPSCTSRSVAVYFIFFPPSVEAVVICGEASRFIEMQCVVFLTPWSSLICYVKTW